MSNQKNQLKKPKQKLQNLDELEDYTLDEMIDEPDRFSRIWLTGSRHDHRLTDESIDSVEL